MIKRIRIAIDHGNRNIKTVHTVFTTGISESDISPGRGIDYLEYNGKFYVPSNRRIPYQRDKTADQRFFLLTLLGIAKEMELNPNMETGIISLYNRITARMRADYDVLLEEADIDSIIQGKKGFYEEKVVRAVLQEANQCGL